MSVKESKSDAVQVFLEKEGIVVDFGRNVTPEGATHERLESVARILLPPATFRRMGMALQDAIRTLPPDPQPQTPASREPRGAGPQPTPVPTLDRAPRKQPRTPPPSIAAGETTRPVVTKPALEDILEPTIDMPSSKATPSAAGELSAKLMGVVTDLRAPYIQERSFRIRRGELLSNRFLLSVGRPNGVATDTEVLAAFSALGVPESFQRVAEEHVCNARCVHFGFEGDGDRPMFKVYLEVAGKAEGVEESHYGAVLEHIAYKWDPTDPDRGATGRYYHYPRMEAEEIHGRVDAVYDGATPESRDIAHAVIDLACTHMPARDIHYLEIEEDGNDRRSFDINFYDAGMRVRDLQPLLGRMRAIFDVEPGRFQLLYDQIKGRRFGHLAGGIHRNGNDFFNLYYGPEFFDQGVDGEWRSSLHSASHTSSRT